jgi:hypothetical protein
VPADNAGGWVQVKMTDVGPGTISGIIYAVSDGGEVTRQHATNAGQNLSIHFEAASGRTYRVDVTDYSGSNGAYTYKLEVAYNKVIDAFEPNDTRATARTIALGSPVTAACFAGFTAGEPVGVDAYQDWYKVDLAAGSVTIKVDDPPMDISPEVRLFDSSGREIRHEYNPTKGGAVTLTRPGLAAGVHTIQVGAFAAPEAEGKGLTVPEHFTGSYKLTVTQP